MKTGPVSTLTSATFNLSLVGAPIGSFQAWFAKVDPSAPGGISQYQTLGTFSDATLMGGLATYSISLALTYTLAAHAFYVVGL